MAFREFVKPFKLRDSKASDEAAQELSVRLNHWLVLTGPTQVYQTCATCIHMTRVGPAVCELAQMTPPIDTIMRGCDKFEDELPRTRSERRRKDAPAPEGFGIDEDIPF